MTKIQLIQTTAQTLLDSESKIISANEYNELVSNAKSQDEIDFYAEMYNYLLGQKQQKVIANEKY